MVAVALTSRQTPLSPPWIQPAHAHRAGVEEESCDPPSPTRSSGIKKSHIHIRLMQTSYRGHSIRTRRHPNLAS